MPSGQPKEQLVKRDSVIFAGSGVVRSEEDHWSLAYHLQDLGRPCVLYTGTRVRGRALSWEESCEALVRVSQKTGIPAASEVSTAQHCAWALEQGVSMIFVTPQMSYRMSGFDEIVSLLKGADVSVLIRRPLVSKFRTWAKAFERVLEAGVSHVDGIISWGSFEELNDHGGMEPWNELKDLRAAYPEIRLIHEAPDMTTQALDREVLRSVHVEIEGLIFKDGLTHPSERAG